MTHPDERIAQRLKDWNLSHFDPASALARKLFPTYASMAEFMDRAYGDAGTAYGHMFVATFKQGGGTGRYFPGGGTGPGKLDLVRDLRLGADLKVRTSEVALFARYIRLLNVWTCKLLSNPDNGPALQKAWDASRKLGVENLTTIIERGGCTLFDDTGIEGFEALEAHGVPVEYSTALPLDYGADSLGFTPYESLLTVAEAIRLYESGVPVEYVVACQKAGVGVADIIGYWRQNIPLEFATA
jgi:hypothetical protein